MSFLKSNQAKVKRRQREHRLKAKAVSAAVESMKDDKLYTMRRTDGAQLTLTGAQWKQLESQRQSLSASQPSEQGDRTPQDGGPNP